MIKVAFALVRQPCVIEVEALEVNALNGLPGLSINGYIDKLGLEGFYELLDGHEDKSAKAISLLAYMDMNCSDKPIMFLG